MTFLAYLGSMISPKVTLHSELRPQPRLYMINLGSSADSRKSSSLGHVDAFFRRTFIGFGDYVHFGLGSAEGLARRLGRDPQTKEIKPLVVHLDEARVLTDKSRHDGSILLPMLASLFERNEFDNSTKTHIISIRDGYVSIVAACTPETYATMWTTSFLDLGFTNRIWLVTGEAAQRVALPREIPDGRRRTIASALASLLTRIEAAAGVDLLVLPLDDEARTLWEAWYQTMARTIHSRRLDTYGWRLMILLSLSRGDLAAVSGDTVRRVCALLDHQLALRREFDPVDAENTVARIEELIRPRLAGQFRQRRGADVQMLHRHQRYRNAGQAPDARAPNAGADQDAFRRDAAIRGRHAAHPAGDGLDRRDRRLAAEGRAVCLNQACHLLTCTHGLGDPVPGDVVGAEDLGRVQQRQLRLRLGG